MKVNFIIAVITVTFLSQTLKVDLIPDETVTNITPKITAGQAFQTSKQPQPHPSERSAVFIPPLRLPSDLTAPSGNFKFLPTASRYLGCTLKQPGSCLVNHTETKGIRANVIG